MLPENPLEGANLNRFFSDLWWLVLIRGLAILALGVLFLLNPLAATTVLLMFLGAYWVIEGVFTIVRVFRTRSYLGGWGWSVFWGIVSILAGVIVFVFPILSAAVSLVFAVTLVSVMAFLSGIFSIADGIRLRKVISNEWSLIIGGAIMIVLAALAFLFPFIATAVLVWAIGIAAIAGGIVLIVLSFRMRKTGAL